MNKQDAADEAFIDECRFAKVVNTPRGDAILIAGEVIEINVPPAFPGEAQPNYVQALVAALRRGASDNVAVSGLHGLATAGHVSTAA